MAFTQNYKNDLHYMRRCLALGVRYYGRTGGNPLVGAVVVRDGKIVGKGAHRGAGSEHAEVLALGQAGGLSRGATLYVTLEPCNHFGKTGPCVDAIIAAGVGKVVYGLDDPNPVASGGAQRLRDHGIEVVGGVFSEQIKEFLYPWIFELKNKRKLVDIVAFVSIYGSLLRELPKFGKKYLDTHLHSNSGKDIFSKAKFDRLIVVRLNSKFESEPWPLANIKLDLERAWQFGSKTISIYRCSQE